MLTEAQAAERLNLRRKTLQTWRYSGRGPRFTKLGGAIRYPEEDLEAFIAENMIEPTRKPTKPSRQGD